MVFARHRGGHPVAGASSLEGVKNVSVVTALSIPDLLRDRAAQPNDLAYKFVDYEVDPSGFAETLTFAQILHRLKSWPGIAPRRLTG